MANVENLATTRVPSDSLLDEKVAKGEQPGNTEPIDPSWEDMVIDPDVDRRLTRKFDKHVVPWLFGLWLLAFIDRYEYFDAIKQRRTADNQGPTLVMLG